jgi:SAM-dependent methyltransferase
MDESSKTKKLWGEFELFTLKGKGIDIGCGADPVQPEVQRFDVEHGDANEISKFVHEEFDYVYASHCLEHMRDPRHAVLEWWKLVRQDGYLFFIVPDEDLYEQGVFPSRFNSDHKATFTISKRTSWSPVSINVLDLARSLPGGQIVSLVLQDHGYDRSLLKHGPTAHHRGATFALRVYRGLRRRFGFQWSSLERWLWKFAVVDQTLQPEVSAQIQCIVKKAPTPSIGF